MSEQGEREFIEGRNGGRLRIGGPPRKKGLQNKITRVLKEAIVLAAEQIGEDGNGKDGLVGYLRRVARSDPKTFCALLGRIVPLQITGKDDGPIEVEYLTREQVVERLRERGLHIDHVFMPPGLPPPNG